MTIDLVKSLLKGSNKVKISRKSILSSLNTVSKKPLTKEKLFKILAHFKSKKVQTLI